MIQKILRCFQNNVIRNFSNNLGTICSMLILPVVVITSFYVTKLDLSNDTIATVNVNQNLIKYLNENHINYSRLDNYPTKFDIYTRKFTGVIQYEGNEYKTYSFKGNTYKKELDLIVARKYSKAVYKGKTAPLSVAIFQSSSILLIQTVLNMKLFIDDRKNGVSQRLRIIGVKDYQYLISYFIFNWLSVAIPFCITTLLCYKFILASHTVGYLTVLFVGLLIAMMFSMLALLICTAVRDNASAIMVGNIVACFTALLSGMFGEFKNGILKWVSEFMPQKLAYNWINSVVIRDIHFFDSHLVLILIICISSFILTQKLYSKFY